MHITIKSIIFDGKPNQTFMKRGLTTGCLLSVLTLITCAMTSPLVNIPYESAKGFCLNGIYIAADSSADFSDITRYGEFSEWRHFMPDSATVIVHRNKEWFEYLISSVSSFICHKESAREKRDFILDLDVASYGNGAIPYFSRTRRDMSFVYTDKGHSLIRTYRGMSLILADGDTIKNCNAIELNITYSRYRNNNKDSICNAPLSETTETETIWFGTSVFRPYAAASRRETVSAMGDTVVICQSTCFPRELNENTYGNLCNENNINNPTPKIMDKSSENHIVRREIDTSISKDRIYIEAPEESDLLICDTSGKCMIADHFDTGIYVTDISAFPPGEYVISIICGELRHSSTFIIRQ